MTNLGSGVIEMPALGRPFKLGMLYDCRTEKLIPGVTLWDPAESDVELVSQPRKSIYYDFVTSDKFSKKAKTLNMNGNLKISFLANLLELSGSANYLKDRTSSSDKKRTALTYKCTTKFESLSYQLCEDSPQISKLFTPNIATHVVTGILYGSQVFLVFDQKKKNENETGETGFATSRNLPSRKETKKDSKADTSQENTNHDPKIKYQETKDKEKKYGENQDQDGTENDNDFRMSANILPILFNFLDFHPYVGGDGDYKLTEGDKNIVDSTKIKFYGDFIPPSNPVTFEDAMELCKKLPTLIGQSDSIPQKVWLFPLSHLNLNATSHLQCEIDANIVHKTEVLFEQLHDYKIECTDFLNTPECKMFAGLHRQVFQFREVLQKYVVKLQSQLSKLLPKIRGAIAEQNELEKILDHKDCPFQDNALSSWLGRKRGQALFLKNFVKDLDDVEFISKPGILDDICFKNKYVVCFTILTAENDPFLQAMEEYIEKEEAQSTEECLVKFYDEATKIVKKNAKIFQRLILSSKSMSATKFIIREEFSSDRSGGVVYLYEDGELKDADYQPPSEPRDVKVSEINPIKEEAYSFTISWEPPTFLAENVAEYEVHVPSDGDGTKCLYSTNKTSQKMKVPTWCNTFWVKSCSPEGLGFISNAVDIRDDGFVHLNKLDGEDNE